jgi:hypothetical protein
MSKHRKSWSKTQKATVLQHYHSHGIASTSRQFEVSASMIYRWLVESKETTAKQSFSGISFKSRLQPAFKRKPSLKRISGRKRT